MSSAIQLTAEDPIHMFSKEQEKTLKNFADLSDKLFELGVISTDSFTGEIGEYIACKHFNLNKSARVTRAIDGISKTGEKYQVKAKVISNNNFSYSFKDLEHNAFDYLVVIYFDRDYNPLKIFRVPSKLIKDGEFRITASTSLKQIDVIDKTEIKISPLIKKAINDFAKAYNELETSGIIRSRRIVGDIGEFYACRKLNLQISENKNEKGIDARHSNGLTFEIKTRRVYQSGRRTGEARRINNLDGKTADYLIVVVIDRAFVCAGMWIIPMRNISNPNSAHLTIVNNTTGTKNVIPSKIDWLSTGDKFSGFGTTRSAIKTKKKPLRKTTSVKRKNPHYETVEVGREYIPETNSNTLSNLNVPMIVAVVIILLYLLGILSDYILEQSKN